MKCNNDQNEQLKYIFDCMLLRNKGVISTGSIKSHDFKYIPNFTHLDVYHNEIGQCEIDDIAVHDNEITLWLNAVKHDVGGSNVYILKSILDEIDINKPFEMNLIDSATGKPIELTNFAILEQGQQYLQMILQGIKKTNENMKTKKRSKKQIIEAIQYWNKVLSKLK